MVRYQIIPFLLNSQYAFGLWRSGISLNFMAKYLFIKIIWLCFLMMTTGGVDPLSSELMLSFWLLVAHHDGDNLSLLFWEPWCTPDLLSGVCISVKINFTSPLLFSKITEPHETRILIFLVRQLQNVDIFRFVKPGSQLDVQWLTDIKDYDSQDIYNHY